jgi:hypothetical protein
MFTQRKTNRLFWILLVLIGLNLTLAVGLVTQSSMAQTLGPRAKYMYKVVKAGADEQSLQTVVDLFARDGWEVVTHYNDTLIFKK